MAAFIFSGALAFVLYQALAFAHVPSPTREWFRISSITISFDESSARWGRLILRAGIVFIVLACVLLIHEVAGPVDVISRNRVSILVGFFFGPLFAIWINAIFAHPPGEALTRGQVIAGIGLVLMFILGSLGNETGRLIQQYANKLQSLKLAGAELSFSEKNRTDHENKLAGALQLAGAAPITGSAALDYLSQLDVIIQRDADYLQAFGGPPGDLKEAASFVTRTVKKPLACLATWYQWTADTPSINRHARAFAGIFRDLAVLDDANRIAVLDDANRIRKQIAQESLSIASDVAALEIPQEVDADCKDLFGLFVSFCPPGRAMFKSGESGLDRSVARACLATGGEQLKKTDVLADSSPLSIPADDFVKGARAFLGGHGGVEARPYLAVAEGGLMIELGSYEGGASRLHSWLRDRNPTSAVPVVQEWLDVRARSMMAAYVEEWIGEKGSEIPTTLRTLHLQNLDILRKALAHYVTLSPVFAKNLEEARARSEAQFRTPVACTTAGGDFTIWQRLFASYLSMDVSYVQNALRHPDYPEKYAQSVSRDVVRLASLDLSCHPAGNEPTDPLIAYAEVLQAYAWNAASFSAARRNAEPQDAAVKRLNDGERAAQLGLEIVQTAKALPGSMLRKRKSFLEMITPNRADNAEAELKRVMNDIKTARSDMGE